jgi:nucleotide-binding universal stress UspA family protein
VLGRALLAHPWHSLDDARATEGRAPVGTNFRWVASTHDWLRDVSTTSQLPVVRTAVAVGEPGPVILERAQALRADLIVIGRNGAHATSPTEIGSATRLVLRGSRLPTLVVPNDRSAPAYAGRRELR